MALRVPIRFNRFLRAFATWVIGFGFVYGIISSLSGSSHDRTDALRSEIAGADSAICVPRAGEGIVGLNRHLRPHVTIDRPSSPYPQLAAGPSLPLQCLEDWLSQGVASCYGPSAGANMKLDVVWTWVNGSDSRWKEVKSLASQEEGIFSPGFHFRCVCRFYNRNSGLMSAVEIKTSSVSRSARCLMLFLVSSEQVILLLPTFHTSRRPMTGSFQTLSLPSCQPIAT